MKTLQVVIYRRLLDKPVEITDIFDNPQKLTHSFIVREKDGDLLFLSAGSNHEIIHRKIRELAESRGETATIDETFVREYRQDEDELVTVAVDSTTEDSERTRSRMFASTCPFCDHELHYTGTPFQATRAEAGFVDLDEIPNSSTCVHFHNVDTDPDIVVYLGTTEELARVDFGGGPGIEENLI